MPDTSAYDGFLQWPGERIACPRSMASLGGVLFYAELPLHAEWPEGMPNKARVKYENMPLIELRETMNSMVENIDDDKQFNVSISYKVNDDTLVARLDGINKFDTEQDLQAISNWHLNMDVQPPVNLFDTYPLAREVRDVLKTGETTEDEEVMEFVEKFRKMDRQQLDAFFALESTDNGVWLLSGCPGSGKTHLCLLIVAMILKRPVDAELLKRKAPPILEVTDPGTVASSSGQESSADALEAPKASDSGQDSTVDASEDLKASGSGQGSIWDIPEELIASDSGQDSSWDAPEEPAKLVLPKVLIVVRQNLQGDDVANHLNNITRGDIEITRCNSVVKEVSHGKKTGLAGPVGFDEAEGLVDFLAVSQAIAELDKISDMVKQSKSKPKLTGGNLSLTARVRDLVANGQQFARLKTAFEKRGEDPATWDHNKAEFSEQINEALRLAVKASQVIICTPVQARNIACKFSKEFKPSVILLEESGRMTEPDVMAAIGHFPSAVFVLISGDYMQIGPLVLSELAHLQKKKTNDVDHSAADNAKDAPTANVPINVFGKQVQKSLLKRAHETGQEIHYLLTNFRSNNGIERLASSMAYKGQMISGHDDYPTEAQIAAMFIRSFTKGAQGSILFVDVQGNHEVQEGSSVSNPAHTAFITSLVSKMFGFGLCQSPPADGKPGKRAKGLIMSPYRAQVQRMQWALGSLSTTEYCPELVDVRTIDSAMGHTTDIAILDLTRSSKVGFTNDLQQLNVGLTHSRLALIIIGNR